MRISAKIFIVTSGCYSDYSINCVFSNKEAAQKYCNLHNLGRNSGYYEIEEWQVDDWDTEEIAREHYECWIYIDNGDIKNEVVKSVVERPEFRCIEYPLPDYPRIDHYISGKGRRYIGGNSYISAEHALRIAADRRTAILIEQTEGLRDKNFNVVIIPTTMVDLKKLYGVK